jgi:hypothetical protein
MHSAADVGARTDGGDELGGFEVLSARLGRTKRDRWVRKQHCNRFLHLCVILQRQNLV